ncbi:hypothetical protein [Lacinutrix undariae]
MIKICLFVITLLLFFTACNPRIQNDEETLDKVFTMQNFDIQIINGGCFGEDEYLFDISKSNKGYTLTSQNSKKSHLISEDKFNAFKAYLKPRIGANAYGGCTAHFYIRVGTLFNSVEYTHSFCSGPEAFMLDSLLNYKALSVKENAL